jgi:hypothetical protein
MRWSRRCSTDGAMPFISSAWRGREVGFEAMAAIADDACAGLVGRCVMQFVMEFADRSR